MESALDPILHVIRYYSVDYVDVFAEPVFGAG